MKSSCRHWHFADIVSPFTFSFDIGGIRCEQSSSSSTRLITLFSSDSIFLSVAGTTCSSATNRFVCARCVVLQRKCNYSFISNSNNYTGRKSSVVFPAWTFEIIWINTIESNESIIFRTSFIITSALIIIRTIIVRIIIIVILFVTPTAFQSLNSLDFFASLIRNFDRRRSDWNH